MTDDEAWRAEERLWTGGAAAFRAALDAACVMAFPAPAGIMAGEAILRGLEGAPRWASVAFAHGVVARPATDLLVLAYRAEGRRATAADAYVACCTSTYRLSGDGHWLMVQHQQSPA